MPPPNVEKILDGLANSPQMQAAVTQAPVLLFAVADQNLYAGDQIHFGVQTYPDRLIVPAGQAIAFLVIPSGKNVSADVAMAELLAEDVPGELARAGMPPFFAGNVITQKTLPDMARMRQIVVSGSGTYLMTAFAATDIYPHTFSVPVVITLQKAPAQ